MADLITTDDGRDRGQLLLVTGFALAVIIVALVLLLNTAIYTQNLATRGTDVGADEALSFRDTVEENLWPAVEQAAKNDVDDPNRTDVEANVTDRIDRFAAVASRPYLAEGSRADVEPVGFVNGTRLRQTDGSRNATDVSNQANWTMVAATEDVRRLELNTTGGLQSTTDPRAEAFRIQVTGSGGDEWRVFVYDDAGATVAVENGTFHDDVCSDVITGPPRLNLAAGTVNGVDCEALTFAENVTSPYEIQIAYGNRTRATYDAIVRGQFVPASNFDSPPNSPYTVPAVYGVRTRIAFQSASIDYRVEREFGPGSPPDGRTLEFAEPAGTPVKTSNGDVLEFRIENVRDRQVTVEAFEIDATDLGGGITVDDGGSPELDVRGSAVRTGEANRDPGAFSANGTRYHFVDDSTAGGQYAIVDPGATDVEVDVQRFSQSVGTLEVTYAEFEADLTITLVLRDGSTEVFYFDEQ
jgi:hypothetical protein